MPTLFLAGEPAADELLSRDPLALVIGMLLDQQVPMERAFAAPQRLAERLDGASRLDPARIAGTDPDALAELFRQPPALHRFPGAMAGRVHELCRIVSAVHGGDVAAVWRDADSGEELFARLRQLPGFGDRKARIFTALLGKQLGVTPPGWREAAGEFGHDGPTPRSVADVTGPDSLAALKEEKKRQKQARGAG